MLLAVGAKDYFPQADLKGEIRHSLHAVPFTIAQITLGVNRCRFCLPSGRLRTRANAVNDQIGPDAPS